MRFDEIELEPVVIAEPEIVSEPTGDDAARGRRLFALLTDLSLFAALSLALAPLLPQQRGWSLPALAGFIVIVSYYYFVGTWLLWGKTIGGAIFDVRVISDDGDSMTVRRASMRWAGMIVSLLTGTLGFLLAALPSRLSLADRLSETRCVGAR